MFFLNHGARGQFALEGTRHPMYAGSWYEADEEKLRAQLESMLKKAQPVVDAQAAGKLTQANPPLSRPVMAIVVPHAGYSFSGQGAAYSYKALEGQPVKRVFLLGPSHHVPFQGAALPSAVTFQTPLGDLDVDIEVVNQLKDYPQFKRMPDVHKVEHSLEMQLPFIKQTFGDVKIVPICVGLLADDTEMRLMAEILKGYIRTGDLVVVSSDFTHYGPRYDYMPFKDNVKENIRKLDSKAFEHLSNVDLNAFVKFQESTKDTICGYYPCTVLCSLLPEGSKGTLLQYYTSQDTTVEDKDNSVSYLSIAFSGPGWPEHPESGANKESIKLSAADHQALLKLARGTVEAYVRKKEVPTPEQLGVTVSKPMKQLLGAFVTLNKFGSNGNPAAMHAGKELRGCIGYIWPLKPLYQTVIDNAVSACSRDYRFNSVQPDELKDIKIEISVLTPPRRIADYHNIVLGRDGMVMFKDGHQAVFLPFVAPEFGWTLPETLTQLSKKAGLGPDDWQQGAKFDTFQADVFEEHAMPVTAPLH
jgi:MEMO1 family protein